jgi:hypothetical protein
MACYRDSFTLPLYYTQYIKVFMQGLPRATVLKLPVLVPPETIKHIVAPLGKKKLGKCMA